MENKLEASNILNSLPFMFEKNIGQHDKQAKFVLKQRGCTTFFTASEVVLALSNIKESLNNENNENIKHHRKMQLKNEYELNVLKIKLENSNSTSEITGEYEFKCKINYLKGSSKDEWTTDIPIYEKVLYRDVYPGIDVVYYGNEGKLEHDFIVSPGADISNISINFEGCDNIALDREGNILIDINENKIQMLKPRVYQNIDGKTVDKLSEFVINDSNKVSFKVENYDEDKVLIIDPQLIYGSYFGGSSIDSGYGIAIDANENVYITGYTTSAEFPVTNNAYQGSFQGDRDAFLLKINTKASVGSQSLLYGSYIGGAGYDYGRGIALDINEYAYITGITTSSSGFPITGNAYQSTMQGDSAAFIVKIDTNASTGPASLLYGTYIGGNGYDDAYGIVVDSNENAYITGQTNSASGFPITSNAYQSTLPGGFYSAFLIKIDINASTLSYGTYIGGSSSSFGAGVELDINENAYVTGYTWSTTGFPITSNAYQSTSQGDADGFIVKIDTKASTGPASLLYGTYLGGNNTDESIAIAVDKNEYAYVTGYTNSTTGFPITNNAYQSTFQGGYGDGFIIKIDTKASTGPASLLYGTYIGGNGSDVGYGIAVDNDENVFITGYTNSTTGFPITDNAYQRTFQGGDVDAILIKVDTKASTGSQSLLYGTYIGGNGGDHGYGIVVGINENAYITGMTSSSSGFPITNNAYQSTLQGSYNSFLIKLKVPLIAVYKSVSRNYSDTNTTLIYSVALNNNAGYTLNNINFIDTIPQNTIMVANSLILDGTTIPGSTNYPGITIPSIGVGDISTIQFSVRVDSTIPSPNYITNTATAIYTSTIDSTIVSFNSNIVTTTIVNANLNNTFKHVDAQYAACGDTITYSISLYNSGNITAENIFIMDTIPNGISFISDSVVVNGTTLPGENPFLGMTLPNIGAGSTNTVSFKVKIDC